MKNKDNYCYLQFEDREWQRKDRPAQSKSLQLICLRLVL